MFMVHYAPKVASSQAKIDRNFANYFLKLNKKNALALKCTYLRLQKRMSEAKSKAKALLFMAVWIHVDMTQLRRSFACFKS